MYSIGQVSAMTNLPISTLRYYDKEGFFPNLEKQSGIRNRRPSSATVAAAKPAR
jgi:DNA-binding transcriptional MerR regulator